MGQGGGARKGVDAHGNEHVQQQHYGDEAKAEGEKPQDPSIRCCRVGALEEQVTGDGGFKEAHER